MRDRRLPLTITLAVLALVGASTALLVFDPRVTSAEALRTGGLAAGSVVALYALWLNDRRRVVEERRQELEAERQRLDSERYALEQRRQELEDRRTGHDRERVADERFARSVELLGHEADQVRVGALHALAGLAASSPAYTQTVLDVLCSYLRRPFDHPKWTWPGDLPEDDADRPDIPHEVERERHVRQTAQRLITDLLPTTGDDDPAVYDLDLTRAWLERFNLSNRVVGRIAAYRCRFRHTTNFKGARIHGDVALRDSRFLGRIRADGAVFHGGLQLHSCTTFEPCSFDGTEFHGTLDLKHVEAADRIYLRRTFFGGELDLRHARLDGGVEFSPRTDATRTYLHDIRVSGESSVPVSWELVASPDDGYLVRESAA
ncbi:pentapeptide repeat protein [Saccharopolyspora erythraea NRRL 2338]|uniref:Uncharacterized protein n=2 Tax=Saccharopolyspora erythraea TaxID=1836 RepID=A4FQH2_SACEN|nr:pentapeptide repeat-containing protein [Saccharopolyspora erythraea]EQD86613.1 hypothetical protein N599_08535 [Saccharopolyspora erythraea D]PFG92899.1 pentapeptide repeat protein [Saccharopolyspora erythraea NRRL 2338]QRK89801.1 pentapeptide repeat-containing protein [Saccharopolyspora erythraea]CAM06297.1 hypothetical protein SACE_7139 [Saccharopolyspora erythraea NRRL 2338]